MSDAENDGKSSQIMLGVSIFCFSLLFLLFYLFPQLYVYPISFVRSAQLYFLSFLPFLSDHAEYIIKKGLISLEFFRSHANKIEAEKFFKWNEFFSPYVTPIYYVIIIPLVYKLWVTGDIKKKSVSQHTDTVYSVKDFVAQEATHWRKNAFIKREAIINGEVNSDIRNGPWRIAENPYKYFVSNEIYNESDGFFDSDLAASLFLNQIGPLFYEKGAPPVKGYIERAKEIVPLNEVRLFAVFMIRMTSDIEDIKASRRAINSADEYLCRLGELYGVGSSADYSSLDVKLFEEAKSCESHPNVVRAVKSHAYFYTIMASCLSIESGCRITGVFPSSDFLWLKKENRTLWYMLNGVGRGVSWIESAGPWSHYLSEKISEKPLLNPSIQGALDGSIAYLTPAKD